MQRMLRFRQPVALLVEGGSGALQRIDQFSEESDAFVFDSIAPLSIQEVDGEAQLVLTVWSMRHLEERYRVLVSDIAELKFDALLCEVTARKMREEPAVFLKDLIAEIQKKLLRLSKPYLHLV